MESKRLARKTSEMIEMYKPHDKTKKIKEGKATKH
jgi:hypothetical protein